MKNKSINGDIGGLISEARKYVADDCQVIVGKYIENELKKVHPSNNISGFDAREGYLGTDNWEQGYIIEKTEIKPFKIGRFKLWNDHIDTRIVKINSSSKNSSIPGNVKTVLFTFYDKSYESDLVQIIRSAEELTKLHTLISYHYILD